MTSRLVGMLALAALLSCGSDKKSGGPAGTGMTATMMVTASGGGMVVLEGTTLTVPPGALPADTVITITSSMAAPPSGFSSWNSPVFKFEPDGLEFLMPVPITITFTGSPTAPAVHWSSSTHGLENLGGAVAGNRITAFVTHFSEGFVAEGGDVDAGVASPLDAPDARADAPVPDAGPLSDGGAPPPDSFVPMDGSVADAGVPSDASSIDGSPSPDASIPPDGNVGSDGGPPPSPDGGATPIDAGPTPDGGPPPPDGGPLPPDGDAGTSPDGGSSPTDAAPLPDAPMPDAGL